MGILVNTGFDVGSSNPIDSRTVKNTTDERDALISDGLVYENLKVYCKDVRTEYRWTGTEWEKVGTVDLSGYAKTYTSLAELGLDTTATINDIVFAMKDGTTFTYKTDVFDYATEYENLRYATVTIIKQSVGRVQIFMTDKDTGALYVGRLNSANQIVGWTKMITENSDPYACTSYKALTGTEDLFTLPCGHYVSANINTT